MDEALGIGARSVVIVADVLQQKTDRVELSMTAAEVKDTLSKQKHDQDQESKQKYELAPFGPMMAVKTVLVDGVERAYRPRLRWAAQRLGVMVEPPAREQAGSDDEGAVVV